MIPDINEIIKLYPEFEGIHPACLAVPMCTQEEFDTLCQDIEENGLHDPLLRYNNLLLDGRTRLLGCYAKQQEIRVTDELDCVDPWSVVITKNMKSRQLTVGQKAIFALSMLDAEEEAAMERMVVGRPESGKEARETFPQDNGKARDRAGERIGISGKSVDKAKVVSEYAENRIAELNDGKCTLEDAYKEAVSKKKAIDALSTDEAESIPMAVIVTAAGEKSEIPLPKKVIFNKTNNSVDWASWTWNPVTGCEHECNFCYAREIAHQKKMEKVYPNKFEPTFHEYRLVAPKNSKVPKSDIDRDGRVFVCSMADLFGKWVPDKWIKSVFDACLESPEWQYMFLTKWPARYSKMPLIDRAWYGASIVKQGDVSRIETSMKKIEGNYTKWISMEPMLEPIVFNDVSIFNLVVIGAQTSTRQPDGFVEAFSPEMDWVVDVINQCREAGVSYYVKDNLGLERPGMNLPKMSPKV